MTAVAGIAAIALAACGDAPEEDTEASAPVSASADESTPAETSEEAPTSEDAAAALKGCMVTDSGGVDDRSFNAAAYKGLQQAEAELGVEPVLLESSAETDYAPNVEQLVADDCSLIVTVGFLLAGATGESAAANPDEQYALIDSTPTDAAGESVTLDNVKPLLFDTAQAAYLAGYLAAGVSETGTVATFGGIPIPPVTVFMDGFVDGVAAYNSENGAAVKVLGWDKAAQDGVFTGDFTTESLGQSATETFISQGADIIFPVAGPVGNGAAAAAQAAGNVKIIWVDSDGYETTTFGPIILTSVLKNIDAAVFDVMSDVAEGAFSADPYVGTLENGGVGLAPYHDLEASVPADLQEKITALQESIISGETVVESAASPVATS